MDNQKEKILMHHKNVLEWVISLESISEEQWRRPIDEGKWSVAEIIGHFIPWDRFVLESRIPYFKIGKEMPPGPDPDELNHQAAKESRKRSKHETIEAFILTRQKLHKAILTVDDQEWHREITIGKSKITIHDYFNNLAKHDEHHMKQINELI